MAAVQQSRAISAYGYEQAKALAYSKYGEPADVLSLHSHSISPAYADNLTIRFLASPINPADINQIQGVYPSRPKFTTSLGTATPLAVGGNEGVAEVISTGSKVSPSLRRGDWVLMKGPGLGTWRTHAQTTEDRVVKIEDRTGISAIQAGTASVNPCTAYQMLRGFVELQPGDWFVQNGANSGVGRAAIQLGRHWGYRSINVVRARADNDTAALDAMKADLHALGADVVVTDEELQAPDFRDKVAQWTREGGRSGDIKLALNCVGGKPAVAMAKLLADDAHFVTYGAMARQPLTLPAGMLIFNNIHFDGFWVSRWAQQNPAAKKEAVAYVLQMMRDGKFRDSPVDEIKWDWNTPADALIQGVKSTLEGFRKGKGIFVFGET